MEIYWKSAHFLGQKYIEYQLVLFARNLLKSIQFLEQEYFKNQPLFWGKYILKISSFLEQKIIENQFVFWGRPLLKISPFVRQMSLKSALFQWIFTPSENESIFDTVLFLAMKVISFIQLIFLDVNSVYFQQNFVNFLYNKRPNFSWFSSHENKLKSAEFLPLKRSWFQ